MDNKIRFVSLGEIQDALQSGDWSKILGQTQNGECACGCGGKCGCHEEKQATVEPKVNDTKVNQAKGQAVGSIFSLESLKQALAQEQQELDDATYAFTRLTNEKKAKIAQLTKQIEVEKNKTRFVRKGSDMAITMTKENAEKLMQELSNILNGSQAANVTFNIGNLG